MQNWGIRHLLLFLGLTPVAMMALVLGWYSFDTQINQINRDLQLRGEVVARQLAPAGAHGIIENDTSILQEIATAAVREEDIVRVRYLDADSEVLADATSGMDQPDQALPHQPVTPYSVPIRSQYNTPGAEHEAEPRKRKAIGWVEVSISHDRAISRRTEVARAVFGLTLLGLFVTVVWVRYLANRISGPLFDLTRAVRELRAYKLDTRVNMAVGGELGDLAAGINAMAERLEKARDSLQQQVDQATADLTETLESVEIQNVELDLARKRAIEASTVKSRFLANISHEIRTPLNGIIGFADLAIRSGLRPEQKEYMELLRTSADNLLDIINELLDFSRAESGELSISSEPMELRRGLEEAVGMLMPLAQKRDLELVLLIYLDVPDHLIGDIERIQQILINLGGNAIKFTPAGSVVVRVMLDNETDESVTLRFSVTDTGIGLSGHFRNRLFTPFTQEESPLSKRHQGTGLGLAICKKLVEQMDGAIGVNSEQGKGAEFWFTLPLEKNAAAPDITEPDPLAGQRVIACEPQLQARIALRSILAEWDMDVIECDTPGELINTTLAADPPPAFVCIGANRSMLDSGMLQTLVDDFRHETNIPVLVLGSASETDIQRGTRLPPACCLSKPPRRHRLHERLFRLLGRAPTTVKVDVSRNSAPERPDFSGRLILVADDNAINRKLAVTLLQEAGAEVIEAEDGRECIQLAQDRHPDLILMDLQMPGMSGLDATNSIRQNESGGARTPVVAITASAIPEIREEIASADFDGYITKPFSAETLWKTVNEGTGKVAEEQSVETETAVEGLRDEAQAVRLCGGNRELATELFDKLLVSLPRHRARINRAFEKRDLDELRDEAHALNGAVACCGIPRLQAALTALETAALRDDTDSVRARLHESNRLMDYFSATM